MPNQSERQAEALPQRQLNAVSEGPHKRFTDPSISRRSLKAGVFRRLFQEVYRLYVFFAAVFVWYPLALLS